MEQWLITRLYITQLEEMPSDEEIIKEADKRAESKINQSDARGYNLYTGTFLEACRYIKQSLQPKEDDIDISEVEQSILDEIQDKIQPR